MLAERVAVFALLVGWLVLSVVWLLFTLLAGNGLNGTQGNWLLGGVCTYLLLVLGAGPWMVLRLARAWQMRLSPGLAALMAVCGIGIAALLGLAVLTFGLLAGLS